MKSLLFPALLLSASAVALAEPALTIYNQDFVVVRETVGLNLTAGLNSVACSGVTMQLEPDSVVLRDPAGRAAFKVLEQNYRADAVSSGLLLSLNEGKFLDFITRDRDGKEYIVKGKVLRSGYLPLAADGDRSRSAEAQPIIEVNGQLRFSLPGEPVFPSLSDDAVLKPMLVWQIEAPAAAKFDAELSYVSGGMKWSASYNLISPEKGDTIDLVGWVTVENRTGKAFENAVVKLMAGDVNRLPQPQTYATSRGITMMDAATIVTEKAFDEFHLYSLPRTVTLHDQETKQVEFLRATGVKSKTSYVYNGAQLGGYRGWNSEAIRGNREYGTQSSTKVAVMREFENTEQNGLGQPLPQGRTRFYRRDDADGRLEFTGENTIDHTPRNETIKLRTGDAFDLVGSRRQTDYVLSNRNDALDEAFEIRLRNRKSTPVEIRVVENLYRGANWEITQKSHDFTKSDAQSVEFRVNVPADGETVVTYRVHYSWQ